MVVLADLGDVDGLAVGHRIPIPEASEEPTDALERLLCRIRQILDAPRLQTDAALPVVVLISSVPGIERASAASAELAVLSRLRVDSRNSGSTPRP